MRSGVLAVAGLGLVVVAGAVGWSSRDVVPAKPAELPAASSAEPPVSAPAVADSGTPMVEIIGDRHVPAPDDPQWAPGDDATSVPVPSDAVVSALRDSMKHGDPRTPPLIRSENLRELPSDAELADPDLYQQYEQRQNQKVYASFVTAASQKISDLEAAIARAEADGLPAEQLEEGRQKLEGLRNQRDEILQAHPDVAVAIQSASRESNGQE